MQDGRNGEEQVWKFCTHIPLMNHPTLQPRCSNLILMSINRTPPGVNV